MQFSSQRSRQTSCQSDTHDLRDLARDLGDDELDSAVYMLLSAIDRVGDCVDALGDCVDALEEAALAAAAPQDTAQGKGEGTHDNL